MGEASDADRRLVENERAKLTATHVNGLAIAIFAVGGSAPLVSAVAPKPGAGLEAAPDAALHTVPYAVLGITAFCWIVSSVLHWMARGHLGGLRA